MRKYLASILIFTLFGWFCEPLLVSAQDDSATSTAAVLGMDIPETQLADMNGAVMKPNNVALQPESNAEVDANADPGNETQDPQISTATDTATSTDELIAPDNNDGNVGDLNEEATQDIIEPDSEGPSDEFSFDGGSDVAIPENGELSGEATTTEEVAGENLTEASTSTAELIVTEEVLPVGKTDAPAVKVMAQWVMTGDGTDDDPAAGVQIQPSGVFEKGAAFDLCGVVGGLEDGGNVYGQVFYPKDAAFGANDRRGRIGCGQTALPLCRMQKMETVPALDLFCKNLKDNNPSLLRFFDGNDFDKLCGPEGDLAAGNAAVYCCGQSLAYDDISGNYEAGVMAEDNGDQYSNAVIGQFEYLPLAAVEVNFADIQYGAVAENVRAEASGFSGDGPRLVDLPMVRNVGNTRAQAVVWQDDMGLGELEGRYNIVYGIKSGNSADWIEYDPYIWTGIGGVLDAGASLPVEFSTRVLNYTQDTDKGDYHGNMKIEARIEPHFSCEASAVFHESPDPVEESEKNEAADVDIKVENDENATTTKPLI